MARVILLLGAAFGLLGVGLGAFGAHGLKNRLTPDLLAIFETGVRYQMYHALAMLAVGVLAMNRPSPLIHASGAAFGGGVVIFSGTLYILALTGTRWLGAITPIGGLSFLVGWALLVWFLLKL